MKKFVALVVLGLILQTYVVFATPPKPPRRDINFEVVYDKAPVKIGDTVIFTVSFELGGKAKDTVEFARAKLSVAPEVQYVSGDSVWSGYLEKGKKNTFEVTYRFTAPGAWSCNPVVRTYLDETGRGFAGSTSYTSSGGVLFRISDPNASRPRVYYPDPSDSQLIIFRVDNMESLGVRIPFNHEISAVEGPVHQKPGDSAVPESLGKASVIVIPGATSATKYLEFEADTKIEIIGEPKLGEPFEVVFTFTPLVECYHSRGIPDVAYLRSEKGVNYLEGDTLWTGSLQKGEQYYLRAQYVVESEILFRLRGLVIAMEVVDIIDPPVRKPGKENIGIKCLTGIGSRPIDFRPEEQKLGLQKIQVLEVTDTGLILLDSKFVSPPPELARRPVVTQATDNQTPKRKIQKKKRTWEEAIKQMIRKADLPIKLDSSTPDTIRIAYDPGRAYVFVTDTSVKGIDVELLDGKAEYEKIEEKKGTFRLESDSAVFKVRAGELERVLIVKRAVFDNPSKKMIE